jgi:hypothetical protein
MHSELRGAGQAERPNRPRPRITRSRVARPLLTSLGTATMLAASSFVVLAVSSTGSVRPWDWARADPAAAVSRYQLCGQQGLGAIGCMLSGSFRPASTAGPGPGGAHGPAQPLFSVATVQDQVASNASGSGRPARAPARASTSSNRSGAARSTVAGSQHLVRPPANASTADVLAACQATMKTAQAQGTAATTEVEVECQADLESRCPVAARTLQAQGPAAIQELEDECRAPMSSASPGHDD